MNEDIRKLLRLIEDLPPNPGHNLCAVPPAARGYDCGDGLPSEILQFCNVVIEGALIAFVTGKHFNICPLHSTATAVDARLGRRILDFGEKTPVRAFIEPALAVLHCRDFVHMDVEVRRSLPTTLLTYFGLDEASGKAMLGEPAWELELPL
ncbi:hypothetical protein [Pandoraea cepalis]|uniref:hypothetical protein n=1 Tax=Pandoraea cepalis TaxID=2508294 RepID=UPI00263AAC51|nr:hypothetical protein [Pandoraea cepalis]